MAHMGIARARTHIVDTCFVFFFFFPSPSYTRANKCSKSRPSGFEFPVIDEISPREIDARHRIDSYGCTSMHPASMHGPRNRAPPSSPFSLPLDPPPRHFLPFRLFAGRPSPVPRPPILSRAFGIDRARDCRFFYSTSSRLSSPFARVLTAARVITPTICGDNASRIIGKVGINAVRRSKVQVKRIMRLGVFTVCKVTATKLSFD